MKVTANRDLTYRVSMTRENGENWGYTDNSGVSYQVNVVTAEVWVSDEGVFQARIIRISDGYRVRKDGSQGMRMGYHNYYPRNEQFDRFKEEALRAARAMHLASR
jgi:hypothetical protein